MFDDDLLRLVRELPDDGFVGGDVDAVGGIGKDSTVTPDDHAKVEVEFAPPRDVGGVAERADHRDAGALVGLGEFVCADLDLLAVERDFDGGAEERLESFVVGVGDECHAGRQEFGAGGVDLDRGRFTRTAVGAAEGDLVVGAGPAPVDHFGLGDCRAEVDVPQRRCLLRVRLATRHVAQEGLLADPTRPFVDRRVFQVPVDREPEAAEQVLEQFLVDLDEFVAEFEEVGARDRDHLVVFRGVAAERWLEALDVRLARIASDAVVGLHPAFRRQAVVVPAHRVEHRLAGHALVARDGVGVGVAEHVADVQRPADGRRRRVDGEHLITGRRLVEAVGAIGVPLGGPAVFDAVERRLVGNGRRRVVHRWPRLSTRPHPLPRTFALQSGRPAPPELQHERGWRWASRFALRFG